MTLTITIKMDNAAFGDTDESRKVEAGRILKEYAAKLICGVSTNTHNLRDINGNAVGSAVVSK